MPDLNTPPLDTLEPPPPKKKFSRGIRPDHIARGEVLPLYVSPSPESGYQPIEKLSQSGAKVESNISQGADLSTIKLSQSEAKVESNISHEETLLFQSKAKVEPQLEPTHKPKLSQSEAKVEPNDVFPTLIGLQKNSLTYIFGCCRQRGSKTSGPVTISSLCISLNSTKSAVRKAFQRLEQKQCLLRTFFKDGRGGWSEYSIPDTVYSSLLYEESRAKVEPKLSQSRAKVGTEVEPQLKPSSPIVVIPNLNSSNTTNTQANEEPCFVIPSELSGKVSRRQLSEFVLSGKISESDLQLSLDAFAYDLKNKLISVKHLTNPVGLLIGAIKNNGSYNSAKYVEMLKAELKPLIQAQRETTAEKSDLKNSAEWGSFQKFKAESPDTYRALQDKISQYGFTGEMLEDFLFLEFKKTILKAEPEGNLNPLRPHEARTP